MRPCGENGQFLSYKVQFRFSTKLIRGDLKWTSCIPESPDVHPIVVAGEPVVVKVGVYIVSINDIKESNMVRFMKYRTNVACMQLTKLVVKIVLILFIVVAQNCIHG
jgi:hypothetical protein